MSDIVDRLKGITTHGDSMFDNILRDAATEIERLRSLVEWRPIETAPKETEALMVWPGDVIRIGQRWCDMPDAFKVEVDFGDFHTSAYVPKDYQPTHWLPLPPPPESKP